MQIDAKQMCPVCPMSGIKEWVQCSKVQLDSCALGRLFVLSEPCAIGAESVISTQEN